MTSFRPVTGGLAVLLAAVVLAGGSASERASAATAPQAAGRTAPIDWP
ncbi:hypothetical protein [Streptomyces sp. NPDC127092]